MIKINAKYIAQVEAASSLSDLYPMLQSAIELEHATIPTYLTGMISIKPGTNKEIWDIIHSVVLQEMLHMSIACNILNALDGQPAVNNPAFIPTFPGPLPMGIDNDLIINLIPLSLQAAVHDTYMAIEEPEDPLNFPVKATARMIETEETFATIGQFYQAIQKQIILLAPDQLPGDPAKQMTRIFPPEELFPILTKKDALKAIEIIIEQGEGTPKSPLDPEGELAHYYRFAEIYNGKRLVADPTEPLGYSYSGAPVKFDSDGIYNLYPNTKLADLPPGSEQWNAASEFSQAYSRLINALDKTFNGYPDHIDYTIGMMFDVKLTGQKLAEMDYPGQKGYKVGPTFEYLPLVP
jgi:Ferritin-like